MEQPSDKIIELALKLKALAERGVGGEQVNAVSKLREVMRKHGITMQMLGSDNKTQRQFNLSKDHLYWEYGLFMQIVGGACGTRRQISRANESFFVTMTDAEFIEVSEKLHFYSVELLRDFTRFFDAWIQKNDLGLSEEKDDANSGRHLSREEVNNMLRMMSVIEKKQFMKALR